MFTIEQIKQEENNVKSGADFPGFISSLAKLGIIRNDVYVINGLSVYFGEDGSVVESAPVYEELIIEEKSSAVALKDALKIHQAGETDYITFCRQAAAAGVEKWVTDLTEKTVVYFDTEGHELVKERLHQ
ncbi:DUF1398 domain-containing protein [Pedobacter sp. ASV28]|uniref:DUF1398 domain-containing protein n=1 Tax=Pedobacter sp. ASV28 TaxID=2795123 RepID=UPI0018ED57E5|nr:DUF1398 family protein [Pedobacter sp. ASV28]